MAKGVVEIIILHVALGNTVDDGGAGLKAGIDGPEGPFQP